MARNGSKESRSPCQATIRIARSLTVLSWLPRASRTAESTDGPLCANIHSALSATFGSAAANARTAGPGPSRCGSTTGTRQPPHSFAKSLGLVEMPVFRVPQRPPARGASKQLRPLSFGSGNSSSPRLFRSASVLVFRAPSTCHRVPRCFHLRVQLYRNRFCGCIGLMPCQRQRCCAPYFWNTMR